MHDVCQLDRDRQRQCYSNRHDAQQTSGGCRAVGVAAAAMIVTACHPGPVVGAGSNLSVGGTLAGIVSTESKAPVPDRKVTAIDTATGSRYDATTGVNGGYTIKVPQGTYRLELELRAGERITRQPGETRINKSESRSAAGLRHYRIQELRLHVPVSGGGRRPTGGGRRAATACRSAGRSRAAC